MVFFMPPASIQDAAPDLKPTISRVFKKKEVDLYAISIDSEGETSKAHYDYRLKLLAEFTIGGALETRVSAAFLDLRGKIDESQVPRQKQFGSASYLFRPTGFPDDFTFGGQASMFVVPILSWYLPKGTVIQGTNFTVDNQVIDGSVRADGSGSVVKLDHSKATIQLALSFFVMGARGKEPLKTNSFFSSTSIFDVKSGALLSAEGSMKGNDGTMTFHVRKA